MLIVYRISDSGYSKVKPDYINNKKCLTNAVRHFPPHIYEWIIIADNVYDETFNMIKDVTRGLAKIEKVSVGHGAGTFNMGLDYALNSGEDYIYFLENDYIHREGSADCIYEMLERFGAHYSTLYDAPDKYIPASKGGNPFIDEDGAETTKLYLGEKCHYKLCFSTTMTFASKRTTLEKDYNIIKKYTSGNHPYDFQMFTELTKDKGRSMMCPVPGYATHGETAWLGPLINWRAEANKIDLEEMDRKFTEALNSVSVEDLEKYFGGKEK